MYFEGYKWCCGDYIVMFHVIHLIFTFKYLNPIVSAQVRVQVNIGHHVGISRYQGDNNPLLERICLLVLHLCRNKELGNTC